MFDSTHMIQSVSSSSALRSADGTVLSGRMALADTMEDIIIDAAAALSVAVIAYCVNPARKKRGGSEVK